MKSVQATYTPEAKAGQIVGDMKLELVVLADGSIGDVKVLQSCLGHIGLTREPNGAAFPCRAGKDYERVDGFDRVKGIDASLGLDQQAQKAARQWEFKPGMKDGKPVAVRLVIGMDLHP